MSNDQGKPPQKTIMGWSPNQLPPQPGQPRPPAQPAAPAPVPPAQPAWGQPQVPAPAPAPVPQQPAWQPAPPPAQPAWGQQPQQPPMPVAAPPPAQPAWGQPQPPMAAPPPAQPAWGAPQPPPAQPAWGAPQPPPQQQPAWGAPAPAPMPAPMQPAWNQAANAPQPIVPPQHRPIEGADATTGVSARLRFIRLTYLHLFGAILAFAGLDYAFFKVPFLYEKVSIPLTEFALGGRWNWGVVLAVFCGVSMGTHWLAHHTKSKAAHYVGLVLYVLAEAVIFIPLLMIVQYYTRSFIEAGKGDPNIIRDAAFVTLAVFGALTASVFITKKDFSFLGGAIAIAGGVAMMLIVLSLVYGFNLGIVFAIAMVILAAAQILYETSKVMAHYDPEDYVGASLSLFSSIALLFWYIIQILMRLRE